VLPGLHELFLQGFRPEHYVAVSLEHVRFLSGSLRDILQEITTVTWVLNIYGRSTTQGYCRMDLPGPTTSVGTRTEYSVGPWDYLTCAARYLMA
jgi:hypothetical protein